MTPENMLITVLNSDTVPNLIYDQIEPWFGSKYSIKGNHFHIYNV